jgi:hypothetical protein
MKPLTLKELEKELHDCEVLWSTNSCDCLAFEMASLEKEIKELKTESK